MFYTKTLEYLWIEIESIKRLENSSEDLNCILISIFNYSLKKKSQTFQIRKGLIPLKNGIGKLKSFSHFSDIHNSGLKCFPAPDLVSENQPYVTKFFPSSTQTSANSTFTVTNQIN